MVRKKEPLPKLKRGRKTEDRTGWIHPGGALPPDIRELNGLQRARYFDLVRILESAKVGGFTDWPMVALTAKVWARLDEVESMVDKLPAIVINSAHGGPVVHPLVNLLDRLEVKLKDLCQTLYMTPRARGSSRIPIGQQPKAALGGSTPEAQKASPARARLLKIAGF